MCEHCEGDGCRAYIALESHSESFLPLNSDVRYAFSRSRTSGCSLPCLGPATLARLWHTQLGTASLKPRLSQLSGIFYFTGLVLKSYKPDATRLAVLIIESMWHGCSCDARTLSAVCKHAIGLVPDMAQLQTLFNCIFTTSLDLFVFCEFDMSGVVLTRLFIVIAKHPYQACGASRRRNVLGPTRLNRVGIPAPLPCRGTNLCTQVFPEPRH